jgi:HK97 family phage major capsid protein
MDNNEKLEQLKQQLIDETTKKSYEQLQSEYGKDLTGMKEQLADLSKQLAVNANQDANMEPPEPTNTIKSFVGGLNEKGYFTGVGEEGGYWVTDRNIPQYFEYIENNSIVRPRSFNIPADRTRPDAKVTMLKLQQDSTGAFSEGSFYPVGEGHDYTETDSKIKRFTLEPKKAGCLVYISNELRRNAAQAEAYVGNVLKRAAVKYENTKFFSGSGAGEPYGFQNSDAFYSVTRDTASQVKWADILAMEKVAMMDELNNYVWLASQSTFDYLRAMRDDSTNGDRVYKDGRLDGIPVIWTSSASSLGSANDIMLCNFQYYVTYVGTALQIDTSADYKFNADLYTIRAGYTVDGNTWLDKYITRDDGSIVSPFIGLAA